MDWLIKLFANLSAEVRLLRAAFIEAGFLRRDLKNDIHTVQLRLDTVYAEQRTTQQLITRLVQMLEHGGGDDEVIAREVAQLSQAMAQYQVLTTGRFDELEALVKKLLDGPPIPEAVRFLVTLNQGDSMSPMDLTHQKTGIDFQFNDDGTATGTLTPLDKDGAATTLDKDASVPSWAVSDSSGQPSSAIVIVPSADGLTALLSPSSPPQDGTGFVIGVSSTKADGSVVSGVSDPIDILHTPGAAVSFRLALSQN